MRNTLLLFTLTLLLLGCSQKVLHPKYAHTPNNALEGFYGQVTNPKTQIINQVLRLHKQGGTYAFERLGSDNTFTALDTKGLDGDIKTLTTKQKTLLLTNANTLVNTSKCLGNQRYVICELNYEFKKKKKQKTETKPIIKTKHELLVLNKDYRVLFRSKLLKKSYSELKTLGF